MGVTASLVIFAAGAIMRFAVTATSPDFNVHTVGDILMIVGAVGNVLSVVFWNSWGGFGGYRRTASCVPPPIFFGRGAISFGLCDRRG